MNEIVDNYGIIPFIVFILFVLKLKIISVRKVYLNSTADSESGFSALEPIQMKTNWIILVWRCLYL